MALRILLADDEKEFVETLAERLTLRGHATRVVYDGPSALAAVEDEVPDVAVLDLLMPGLPATKPCAGSRPRIRSCRSFCSPGTTPWTTRAWPRRPRPLPA